MEVTEEELLTVINHAAVDLISTNGACLSVQAIKTRMKRIAEDLVCATEEQEK